MIRMLVVGPKKAYVGKILMAKWRGPTREY